MQVMRRRVKLTFQPRRTVNVTRQLKRLIVVIEQGIADLEAEVEAAERDALREQGQG